MTSTRWEAPTLTAKPGQTSLNVIPITAPRANAAIVVWHRHHAPLPSGFAWYCLGAIAAGQFVGVAVCGRPTNRNNDDGQTVEVLRLATNGHPNAASALLGAAARAAKAIGAWRIITYTLTRESGSSLRGAGWVLEGADTGRSWWNTGNTRARAVDRGHMYESKARWAKVFRARIKVSDEPSSSEAKGLAQGLLFCPESAQVARGGPDADD